MENTNQFSELELNIKALLNRGIKVKDFSGVTTTGGEIVKLKDLDSKKGIVSFYFSAFNIKDSDGDIVRPGAFKRTFKEQLKRIKHLKNHNTTQTPGVILELHEDDYGAYAVSQLVNTILGKDTLIEYETGIITEHSMGFQVVKDREMSMQGAIELLELKLWETTTLNAWGANENTPVIGVKDADIDTLKKNIQTVLSSSNISDERGKELETWLKNLVTPAKKEPDFSYADIVKRLDI